MYVRYKTTKASQCLFIILNFSLIDFMLHHCRLSGLNVLVVSLSKDFQKRVTLWLCTDNGVLRYIYSDPYLAGLLC